MISRLRGTAVARTGERIVLDVGGVGYALAVTPTAARLAESGGEVSLDTYLHVREDTLQLYGFGEPAERELFEHLLAVSGVGPKVALAIVSGSSPARLQSPTRSTSKEPSSVSSIRRATSQPTRWRTAGVTRRRTIGVPEARSRSNPSVNAVSIGLSSRGGPGSSSTTRSS